MTPARKPTGGSGPLRGRRILVLRPGSRAAELVSLLADAGAEPLAAPAIATETAADSAAIAAAGDLADGVYDWVAFTSAAAVTALVEIRAATRPGPFRLAAQPALVAARTAVAAVGPATAAALRRSGITVDLQPSGGHSAAALLAAWPPDGAGHTVLLPHSDLARGELAAGLIALGYRPVPATVYRTVPRALPADVRADLAAGRISAAIVTSPSSCASLSTAPGGTRVPVVAIGATTAEAAEAAGLTVAAVASRATAAELVTATARAAQGAAAGTTTGNE